MHIGLDPLPDTDYLGLADFSDLRDPEFNPHTVHLDPWMAQTSQLWPTDHPVFREQLLTQSWIIKVLNVANSHNSH